MRTSLRLVLAAALLVVALAAAAAPTPLLSLWFVPDITVKLNGVTVSPREVAVDDLMGNFTRVEVGALPEGTRITSFLSISNGDHLLSFDTTVNLGDFTARAGDVVRLRGSTYEPFLDASPAGIPDGVLVDALTFSQGQALVMSFDVTVKLGDLTVAPADLVLYDFTSFSMFFDAAAAGVAPGLDVDAAYVNQGTGHLLISFDGSGIIGDPPVTFDDEDVLEYDAESDSWAIAYDGSLQADGWPPADLKGLLAVALLDTPTPTATPVMATVTPIATSTGTPPATATATATGLVATMTATTTGTSPATATATATGVVPTVTATVTGSPPATVTPGTGCAGDCNGDGLVRIDELIVMVNIALETAPVTACEAGDTDDSGTITINEIIAAVVNALGSCPV